MKPNLSDRMLGTARPVMAGKLKFITDKHIATIASEIFHSDIIAETVAVDFWNDQEPTNKWLEYENPRPSTWPDLFAWLKSEQSLDAYPDLAKEIGTSINEWVSKHQFDEQQQNDIKSASGLLKLSKQETAKAMYDRVTSVSGLRRLQGTTPDIEPVKPEPMFPVYGGGSQVIGPGQLFRPHGKNLHLGRGPIVKIISPAKDGSWLMELVKVGKNKSGWKIGDRFQLGSWYLEPI